MQLIKTYWVPFLASWLVFIPLLFTALTFDFHVNFVATCFAFFTLFVWFCRKSFPIKQKRVNTIILFLPVLAFVGFYFWRGVHSLDTMPNNVVAPLLGISLGAVVQASGQVWLRVAVICVGILANVWVYQAGYRLWANYRIYGTYNGQITAMPVPNFAFQDADTGQIITPEQLKGKVVVLDFWNTSCSICFREFPAVQAKKEQWSHQPNVKFYTVNIRLDRDSTGQAMAMLRKRGVQLPVLLGPNLDEARDKFSVMAYPAMWILNQQGQLVYYGHVENIDPVLNRLTKNP